MTDFAITVRIPRDHLYRRPSIRLWKRGEICEEKSFDSSQGILIPPPRNQAGVDLPVRERPAIVERNSARVCRLDVNPRRVVVGLDRLAHQSGVLGLTLPFLPPGTASGSTPQHGLVGRDASASVT